MRNAAIGAVLAILLIGGLFAAVHFGGTHTLKGSPSATAPKNSTGALSPADVSQIKPSFIGTIRIGDWTLVCGKPRKLPTPPGGPSEQASKAAGQPTPPPNSPLKRMAGPAPNSAAGAPGPQANSENVKLGAPPPNFMIPRCRATMYLPVPGEPKETFRVNFRLFGFRRLLAVFMQVPQETEPGDAIQMETSTKTIPIPVRGCNPKNCLVAQSFKIAETPPIETTRKLTFVFAPAGDGKPRVVKASAYGLPETLATIRRIDK